MPSLENSGTQIAVVGTEHVLHTDTDVKTFTLTVDMAAMEAGDTVELRAYTTVLTGGISRVVYFETFSDAQGANDAIKVSIPLSSDISCKFSLKQTVGVSKSFPWKILSI